MIRIAMQSPEAPAIAVPVGGAAASLGDLDGSYCLETGYCRAPEAATAMPPHSGVMFLAVGIVAFGVGRLVRLRRSA
jgi:hypothetical protein